MVQASFLQAAALPVTAMKEKQHKAKWNQKL